jgi:hypothetical protein
MPADFNIATLRLNPDSFVMTKAPRTQVPDAGLSPSILSAYYDPTTGGVNAVASDYNGIKTVEFVDKDGNARAMKEDLPDSSFYIYTPAQDIANYPNGYQFSGTELVKATNVNNESTTKMFMALYATPVTTAPRIVSVSVDLALHKLYAHVESDTPLDAAPSFVRVYGEVFTTGLGYGNGYCQMERVSNWYEDPTGWVCNLQAAWTTFVQIQGATVVAYAKPELYTSRAITPADQYFHTSGGGGMATMYGYQRLFAGPLLEVFDTIDLDTGYVSYYYGPQLALTYKLNDAVDYQAYDTWLKIGTDDWLYVNFGIESLYLGKQGDPGVDFRSITRGDIQGMALIAGLTANVIQLNADHVFVYRTPGGRLGKLRIKCYSWWQGSHTYRDFSMMLGRIGAVEYEFVTFQQP